jgi:hypothetical protein
VLHIQQVAAAVCQALVSSLKDSTTVPQCVGLLSSKNCSGRMPRGGLSICRRTMSVLAFCRHDLEPSKSAASTSILDIETKDKGRPGPDTDLSSMMERDSANYERTYCAKNPLILPDPTRGSNNLIYFRRDPKAKIFLAVIPRKYTDLCGPCGSGSDTSIHSSPHAGSNSAWRDFPENWVDPEEDTMPAHRFDRWSGARTFSAPIKARQLFSSPSTLRGFAPAACDSRHKTMLFSVDFSEISQRQNKWPGTGVSAWPNARPRAGMGAKKVRGQP